MVYLCLASGIPSLLPPIPSPYLCLESGIPSVLSPIPSPFPAKNGYITPPWPPSLPRASQMIRHLALGLVPGQKITTAGTPNRLGLYTGEWTMSTPDLGLLRNGSGQQLYIGGVNHQATYIGAFVNDCMTVGVMEWRTGLEVYRRFEGEFKNEVYHGYGEMTENRATYKGQFKDGKYHGMGSLLMPNGSTYEGEFAEGTVYGLGVQNHAVRDGNLGLLYVGAFKDSARHGRGVARYSDGTIYVGGFENDLRSGFGVLLMQDGKQKILGMFHEDMRSGFCQNIMYANGVTSLHCGEMQDDKSNGPGFFNIGGVGCYEGGFKQGESHGHGTLTSRIGEVVYTGGWLAGKANGLGELHSVEGVFTGHMADGMKMGNGSMQYADGSTYRGRWVYDKRSGMGFCMWANGDSYDGEWDHGVRDGMGVFTSTLGVRYDGEWHNNKLHGRVEITHHDGHSEHTTWRHGEKLSLANGRE